MPLHLQLAAASDLGRTRQENQDRWLVREDLALAAVADGMGGMACGAEAAQHAIDSLARHADRGLPTDLAGWRALLDELNRAVFALGLKLNAEHGIGTTLTLAKIVGTQLHLAHVGDSAAFRLRAGVFAQLTAEHTVEQEVLAKRAAGLPERMPRSAAHMLTSCLGLPFLPHQEVLETDLVVGDRLLLCSDGLTKPVERAVIADALAQAATPDSAAAALIALANAAGGPDNITAIVGFAVEG